MPFQPGQSGNPAGRPSREKQVLRSLSEPRGGLLPAEVNRIRLEAMEELLLDLMARDPRMCMAGYTWDGPNPWAGKLVELAGFRELAASSSDDESFALALVRNAFQRLRSGLLDGPGHFELVLSFGMRERALGANDIYGKVPPGTASDELEAFTHGTSYEPMDPVAKLECLDDGHPLRVAAGLDGIDQLHELAAHDPAALTEAVRHLLGPA